MLKYLGISRPFQTTYPLRVFFQSFFSYNFNFYFILFFYCSSSTVVCLYPHSPPQPSPHPSPGSTPLWLCPVSFIVVPENPSPIPSVLIDVYTAIIFQVRIPAEPQSNEDMVKFPLKYL